MLETIVLYAGLAARFGVTLSRLSYSWLDSTIEQMEHRFGRRRWGAMLTLIFLTAAALYARPAIRTSALGTDYAQLASDPFGAAPNPVGYRILTPLISYCVGLRGDLIIITNLLITALLILLVYRYFRRVSPHPGDAFIAAAAITFSLVTLTTIYYGGYCDSLTYLIIFLMWQSRKKPLFFYFLFFLGLVNRESIAFLIPWFAILRYQGSSSTKWWLLEFAIGLGLSLGLYMLYRDWMSGARAVEYNSAFYLNPLLGNPLKSIRDSIVNWPIGLFSVFKLMWVTVVVAAVSLWQSGRRREVYSSAVLLMCTFMQVPLAVDTSRLMTLAFMTVVLSLEHLFKENPGGFRKWIGWVLLGSLAVPPLYITGKSIIMMQPLIFNLIANHVATSIQ